MADNKRGKGQVEITSVKSVNEHYKLHTDISHCFFSEERAEKVQEEKPYEQARTSTQRNGTEKNAGQLIEKY